MQLIVRVLASASTRPPAAGKLAGTLLECTTQHESHHVRRTSQNASEETPNSSSSDDSVHISAEQSSRERERERESQRQKKKKKRAKEYDFGIAVVLLLRVCEGASHDATLCELCAFGSCRCTLSMMGARTLYASKSELE